MKSSYQNCYKQTPLQAQISIRMEIRYRALTTEQASSLLCPDLKTQDFPFKKKFTLPVQGTTTSLQECVFPGYIARRYERDWIKGCWNKTINFIYCGPLNNSRPQKRAKTCVQRCSEFFWATYESAQISSLTIQSVSLSRIISANFERIVYSLRISRSYIFLLNFFCLPWRRQVRYTIYGIGFFLADSFKILLGTPIFCIRFACVRSTPTLPVILEREILIPMNTTKKL